MVPGWNCSDFFEVGSNGCFIAEIFGANQGNGSRRW
jgi:hypothetical protein